MLFIASEKAKDMGEDEKISWPIVPRYEQNLRLESTGTLLSVRAVWESMQKKKKRMFF